QSHAYRMRTEAGERGTALNRMRPRSLLLPPGIPDFFTRHRTVRPGPVELQGRAWSGFGPISAVEVSTDGLVTWRDARLGEQPDRFGWVGWTAEWDATPGEHLLACRATDADGNTQPVDGEWNLGGYACNSVHQVAVTVADA
ncbi:MAG: hypothetical protein QOH46_629, partial [Solirubrobacteraceae bacterium]|nr:hypothetical protein [Solirubrobacteraceae bacterium]